MTEVSQMNSRNARQPHQPRTILTFGLMAAAIALPAAGAEARAIPKGNLTENPSFQRNTSGWGGFQAKVKRVKTKRAPVGRTAARVKAAPGATTYAVDDAPATVHSDVKAGQGFTATAYVKGTNRSHGREVGLVIRESTPNGQFVADTETRIRLSKRTFRRIETTYSARATGSVIDVYVRRPHWVPGDSFLVDAISLIAADVPSDDPPVDDPPVDDPPVDDPPVDDPPVDDPPTGPAPTTTSQMAIITSHEDPLFANDGSKYRYLIIRDSLHDRVGELRAAHPEAEILVYKNAAFTVEEEEGCPWAPYQGTGVSYCDADRHESWFLHDSSGRRLASDAYPSQRAMHIGRGAYQDAWTGAVLDRLEGSHYDGVFIDDVNLRPGHGMGGRIAEGTDAQYRQAMVSFIDAIAPDLRGKGFRVMVNAGMDPWTTSERDATLQVAGDVDVVNREGFVRWGENGTLFTDGSGDSHPFWDDEVELAEDVQAAGAAFQGMTYGADSDTQGKRYGRATFLMAWDGSSASTFNYRPGGAGSPWSEDWTTEIGTPTEPRRKVGQGWKRDFSDGTAVINARQSGQQSFNLGGSFRRPDGACTNSVTLGAARGMVLPSC